MYTLFLFHYYLEPNGCFTLKMCSGVYNGVIVPI